MIHVTCHLTCETCCQKFGERRYVDSYTIYQLVNAAIGKGWLEDLQPHPPHKYYCPTCKEKIEAQAHELANSNTI